MKELIESKLDKSDSKIDRVESMLIKLIDKLNL